MVRNKGFSIIEVVIVLAIVGLIGFLGWRFWVATQSTDDSSQTDTSQTETVPAINSDADLENAEKQLDNMNVEGTESQQLDTETSF